MVGRALIESGFGDSTVPDRQGTVNLRSAADQLT
jgi:hypothetical protein